MCKNKHEIRTINLAERIYTLEVINPQIFYGVNNEHLHFIKSKFPQLQFVARGDEVKITGEEGDLEEFAEKFELIEQFYLKRGELNRHILYEIFGENGFSRGNGKEIETNETLLIGTRGQKIAARTANQRALVNSSKENDIIFAVGPAGTGKTYTAVAMAVLALKEKEVRRIILARPAVEAGENLGFFARRS